MGDAQQFVDKILAVMTTPTKRDLQVKIGPSNLGDPCDRCLGLQLAGQLPNGPRAAKEPFNLMAWLGTAAHQRFEREIAALDWPGVLLEQDVYVGKIKGYGKIHGNTDVYSGKRFATILDYKTANVAAIRKYRATRNIPAQKRVQLQAYGLGMSRLGLPVEEVCDLFIPRDSMDKGEIYAHIEPYDPRIVKQALKRAQDLWDRFVSTGKIELLASHKDCFNCNRFQRKVTFVNG